MCDMTSAVQLPYLTSLGCMYHGGKACFIFFVKVHMLSTQVAIVLQEGGPWPTSQLLPPSPACSGLSS